MTATQLLNKFSKVDVELSAQIAIEETANTYTSLQRGQLFQGVDRNDLAISPPYSSRTIAIKKTKGQPIDRVTLKDTGDFYRGILIDVRGDLFVTESADEKNLSLQNKYGKDIFGLNRESKIEWIKTLKPVFFNELF
jgi:hypothetical protein